MAVIRNTNHVYASSPSHLEHRPIRNLEKQCATDALQNGVGAPWKVRGLHHDKLDHFEDDDGRL